MYIVKLFVYVSLSGIASIMIAGGLSILASGKMDGIERIAGVPQYHYGAGLVNLVNKTSLFMDYKISSINSSLLSQGGAGLIGIRIFC